MNNVKITKQTKTNADVKLKIVSPLIKILHYHLFIVKVIKNSLK